MKALISVYDKTGSVEFARAARTAGFSLVSTGGTQRHLTKGGLEVQQVSNLTGFPEILDGRVKTLHPAIHGGILSRRDLANHTDQLAQQGIDAIDLVVVNLYPFVQTISRPDVTEELALENIDVGGPTMIRSAAKNYPHVIVIVDPSDYDWVAERFSEGFKNATLLTLNERRELARKAFHHVALYDTAIANYLSDDDSVSRGRINLGYTKLKDLRYGENPHQKASLNADPQSMGGIVRAKQHHGRELSFNNILDADAAWRVISDFAESTVTVVKHNNPCGLATHPDQPTAYRHAFEGDTTSAYGGIVGFNRTVTTATAQAMRGIFYEIVVAPGYEPKALDILKRRRNLRILESTPSSGPLEGLDIRKVSGGALLQIADVLEEDRISWKVVTERKPNDDELRDLSFAWKAAKHIKSNAIVLAKNNSIIGMGAGQPNRVISVHLSLRIAGEKSKGSSLASDAFFPFADNIEIAAGGGVKAIVQPGGSIRDDEVIAAANQLDIAMVFTGIRHFKH